eukprot:10000703-Lingulodinium_polyedra.AAC.1
MEERGLWTHPPAVYERPGYCWKLKRSIPGSRDGSQAFVERLAPRAKSIGFRRCLIHLCVFRNDELN